MCLNRCVHLSMMIMLTDGQEGEETCKDFPAQEQPGCSERRSWPQNPNSQTQTLVCWQTQDGQDWPAIIAHFLPCIACGDVWVGRLFNALYKQMQTNYLKMKCWLRFIKKFWLACILKIGNHFLSRCLLVSYPDTIYSGICDSALILHLHRLQKYYIHTDI